MCTLIFIFITIAISLNYFNPHSVEILETESKVTTFSFSRVTFLGIVLSLFLLSGVQEHLYNGLLFISKSSYSLLFLVIFAGATLSLNNKFSLDIGQSDTQANFVISTELSKDKTRTVFIISTVLGSTILIVSADILTLLLGLELQSYSVYVLAASYADYEPSESAGLKYFLLGALSSALIFLGLSLVYVNSGSTSMDFISYNSGKKADFLSLFSFILIFSGLCWKVALSPFHAWSIDVYDAVPNKISAILSTLPKIGILALMVKLFVLNLNLDLYSVPGNGYSLNNNLELCVTGVIFCSVAIGSIAGLFQHRIKRLLAYSSVLNMGFLLLAITIGVGVQQEGLINLYLVQYIVTLLGIWLCLTFLTANSTNDLILNTQLQGLRTNTLGLNRSTLTLTSLTLFILSVAGIPPMIGFFAKFEVISLAVATNHFGLALLAIVASLISTVYYLNLVKAIWFTGSNNLSAGISNVNYNLSNIFVDMVQNINTSSNSLGRDSLFVISFFIGLLLLFVAAFILQSPVIYAFFV